MLPGIGADGAPDAPAGDYRALRAKQHRAGRASSLAGGGSRLAGVGRRGPRGRGGPRASLPGREFRQNGLRGLPGMLAGAVGRASSNRLRGFGGRAWLPAGAGRGRENRLARSRASKVKSGLE
jgi:hypothetical protein